MSGANSPSASDAGRFRKDHLPELDGLRGIAVLLVLWVHLPIGAFGQTVAGAYANLLPGNVGVDLFFVLSGFLITRILLVDSERGVPLRLFLIRRFLRIFPIYYLAILLLLPSLSDRETLYCATYTSNYGFLFVERVSVLEHTWSLAVEEHFYLLWPPIVAFLSPVMSRRVLLLGILPLGVLSAVGALVLGDWSNNEAFLADFVGRTSTVRFFSLGLGALIAYHELSIRGHTLRALALVGLGALVFAALTDTGARWLGYSDILASITGEGVEARQFMRPLYAIGMPFASAAALILGIAWSGRRTPQGLLLTLPPLRWVGRISYGLYLYHFPITSSQVWGLSPGVPSPVRTVVVLGLCFGMAWLSFVIIERPLLAIGARFRAGAEPAPRGSIQPLRWLAAAALVGGMFWTFHGGAHAITGFAARHDPIDPPGPEAALGRADLAPKERYAIPFIEEWGPRLDGALGSMDAALEAAVEGIPWRPFVLGVSVPGEGPRSGAFVGGVDRARYVDLTYLLSVAERGPRDGGLVPLLILASVQARAALGESGTPAVDALTGALLRSAEESFGPYPDKSLGAAFDAARAVEAELEGRRPRGWQAASGFLHGERETRVRWLIDGAREGAGALERARSAVDGGR